MGAAVAALSWEVLARVRFWLVLSAVLVALLCLAGQVLPESWRSHDLAYLLVASVAVPVMGVVGSTIHVEGRRLEDTGSLFPTRFFTLPVHTVVLLCPPLLVGTLCILFYWLAVAVCVLRPWGWDVPLLAPALVGATVLASMQALAWWPFSLPWLRAFVLGIVVPGLIAGALILADKGVPAHVIVGISIPLLLFCYATSLIGVSRSRRGTNAWRSSASAELPVAAYRQVPPPFASPLEAQEWLERRRLYVGFVILTLICLSITPVFIWLADMLLGQLIPGTLPDDMKQLDGALTRYGRSWLVLAQLPVLPLLVSAASGGSALGRLSTSGDSPTLSPFLATRALRPADMVAAKLRACAWGIAILWALTYVMGLLWAVGMGRVTELAEHLVAITGSVPAALLVFIGGVIVLPVISWSWLVSGMGVKVLPWPLLEVVPAFFCIGALLFPGLLIADKLEPWRPVLGWMVVAGLAWKAWAVSSVVNGLRREKLVRDQTIAWVLTSWAMLLCVVLALFAVVFGLSPLLAGVAVLLLPLARLLAAPLVLARHRTQ
jgi:hypothetical protein